MSKFLYAVGLFSMFIATPVLANKPIQGTWYNSYCSRVDITDTGGQLSGVYTSHTGSTGSSRLIGQTYGADYVPENKKERNDATQLQKGPIKGIPFTIGIQWRLINVPQTKADGSWHWVSSFAGQYHPAQTVSAPNQDPYVIPETLEILNGLLATGTVPGLADRAPLFWPQTLHFHRLPPSYCQTVTPPTPVGFSPTASDHVSGVWQGPGGQLLHLKADLMEGSVTGVYTNGKTSFEVIGLFDTLAPPASGYSVPAQGLTLTLKDVNPPHRAMGMATGGVNYANPDTMFLWRSNMTSTTWTGRFVQETLNKESWTRHSY